MSARTVSATMGLAVLVTALTAAAEAEIDLRALRVIRTAAEPGTHAKHAAKLIRDKLKQYYDIDSTIENGPPVKGEAAILVGRKPAIATGLLTAEELDTVKYDGYIIKGQGGCLAAAGYRGLGDLYAGEALMRRLGIKRYPWDSGAVEEFTPLPSMKLEPFTFSDKPFFEERSVCGFINQGKFGDSYNDVGQTKSMPDGDRCSNCPGDWVSSDHTANYLLPTYLYYDEHPEYFAVKGGKRLARNTKYGRMNICLSNPAVRRICAERALKWVAHQNDRRFFFVMDADSSPCQCPSCRAEGVVPLGRLLKWANPIAEAVAARYPDKIMKTLAYAWTSAPPLRAKPVENLWIYYCPWYWSSYNDKNHSYDHWKNVHAAEELMGLYLWCPQNVGAYDYPFPLWLHGLAKRLKFYAKHGTRGFNFCGNIHVWGDRFRHVMNRLAWDPYADVEELLADFCRVYYGPAAAPMRQYFAMELAAVDRLGRSAPFRDPECTDKARKLFAEAEALAAEDPKALVRVLEGVQCWHKNYLAHRAPPESEPDDSETREAFRQDLIQYVRLLIRACSMPGCTWWTRTDLDSLDKRLGSYGYVLLSKDEVPRTVQDELEEPAEEDEAPWGMLDRRVTRPPKPPGEKPKKRGGPTKNEAARPLAAPPDATRLFIALDNEQALKGCETDATRAGLAAPPRLASCKTLSGETRQGLQISAPLTRLPVVAVPGDESGINRMHAGRFFFQKIFAPPIKLAGRPIVELHLHASADVPATLYLDGSPRLKADVQLHQGEQIVRVDLRSLKRGSWDYRPAMKELKSVALDLWPQDNFYPYPPTRDVAVALLGLAVHDRKDPVPKEMPHSGKTIWLSAYRSNLRHSLIVPREHLNRTKQQDDPEYLSYPREGTRTFTSHRYQTPILAIIADRESRQAAEDVRGYLRRMFGVVLPVNPSGLGAATNPGNVVVLGREAALASGRIKEKELAYVGENGFVIRASNGRVTIAGNTPKATRFGVARYLEDLGVRFLIPDEHEIVPDLRDSCLRELVVFDWPRFPDWPGLARTWKVSSRKAAILPFPCPDPDAAEIKEVVVAAKAIKRSALKEQPLPPGTRPQPGPLASYVLNKLAFDPLLNTLGLVRDYEFHRGKAGE